MSGTVQEKEDGRKDIVEVLEIEKEKDDPSAFIKNLLYDLLNDCDSTEVTREIEANYQCGECGKMFETEKESETHIESVHTAHKCVMCPINVMKVKWCLEKVLQ